jgi:hypothetical protein
MTKYYQHEDLCGITPASLGKLFDQPLDGPMPTLNPVEWMGQSIVLYQVHVFAVVSSYKSKVNDPWIRSDILLWPLSSFVHMAWCLDDDT